MTCVCVCACVCVCVRVCVCVYLRLVDDSEGLRLSRRGVQGVTAGVVSRALVITQDDVVRPEFRLGTKREGVTETAASLHGNTCVCVCATCVCYTCVCVFLTWE